MKKEKCNTATINKFYNRYERILYSYCDTNTNWNECIEKLKNLKWELSRITPMCNSMCNLNIYILANLKRDIVMEINRLIKIINKEE